MMSKCANPDCTSLFRYLREGKLFQVPAELSTKSSDLVPTVGTRPPARDEFFWLCGACSKEFTIVADAVAGVRTVPINSPRALRATG